ncbi:MAG: DUF89 family protein [Paenibacillaceae bacterium]|nr:DUF89 family protein [Paenibacillaceae bacterium]
MELLIDCIPCLLRQSLEAARIATDQKEIHNKIMKDTIKLLSDYDKYKNSPQLAKEIHNLVKNETGNPDPYQQIKNRDLQAAKDLYPLLKDFMKRKENSVYWALKVAAVGNNLDAAVYNNPELEKIISRELEKEFTICDLEIFTQKLQQAKNILIIGDNTGETIFDRVMLESFPHAAITYGVRNEPIINDVTEKEAIDSGLNKVSRVISTGCESPGTILNDCSPEFLDIYERSDVIISKGQGNFEALSGEKGNLFFLLKAKCPAIAGKFQVKINDYIFHYEDAKS